MRITGGPESKAPASPQFSSWVQWNRNAFFNNQQTTALLLMAFHSYTHTHTHTNRYEHKHIHTNLSILDKIYISKKYPQTEKQYFLHNFSKSYKVSDIHGLESSDENKMFRVSENNKITNCFMENLDDSDLFISEYMFQNNRIQLINDGTLPIAP